MKRPHLEHVLRAAAAITGETEFIVLGSQAVLAQFPAPPDGMLVSVEADLYPLHHPELADVIDGCIGRDSPFHATFGYYADGIGPETALLPPDWNQRAVRFTSPSTGGAVAIVPEIHDLAASKLMAGREKDLAWVTAAVEAGIVDPAVLTVRVAAIGADDAVRAVAIGRAQRLKGR